MSQFFQRYGLQILTRTSEHLWMSLFAALGAVLIGVPLSVFITRQVRWQTPVLRFAEILCTVPALALFGFLWPILGRGSGATLIATVLLSLSPIIRDTFGGLSGVDPNVRDSARALGMTTEHIFKRVELPLAADKIVAGARKALVLSIGLTAIAAFFGAQGLGESIRDGLRTGDNALVLAGAIPTALLVLGTDWMSGIWQQILASRHVGKCELTLLQRIGVAIGALFVVALMIIWPLMRLFFPVW